MPQSDLWKMLKSTSLSDLKSMISAKEKLDRLQEKRSALEKDLSSVDREITAIEQSLGKAGSEARPGKKASAKRKKKGRRPAGGKRASQPSIPSLIVETLREKNRPVSIHEIADSLLNEKKYRTQSRDFKHQLRVVLYANQKGLFKKLGSGEFALAERVPAVEKVASSIAAAGVKQATAKKKAAPKRKAEPKKKAPSKKKALKATAPAKPKSVKNALPKKIPQPSIASLIVDVLREKRKPLTVYEIAGALLNEKNYQTTSKKFDQQIRILLSKNQKGLFKKLGAGKFELA